MNIQQHVSKISWTATDKLMVIGYGFVNLIQIRLLDSADFGLYSLLVALQTYIFILSDGSALQGVIQFGMNQATRPRVNYLTLLLHLSIVLGCSGVVFLLRYPLSVVFNEPRLVSVGVYLPIFCLLTMPRAYCLKLLQRDLQMKQIFWVNCSWLTTMTALTFWFLSQRISFTFQTMIVIAFVGMGVSSLVALVISRGLLRFDSTELSKNENNITTEKVTFRQLLGFGLPQLVVSALHNTIRQLDVYIVQFYFGSAQVGIYNAAKTLFRVFEQGVDAMYGLLTPGTVKFIQSGEKDKLIALLTKSVSIVLLLYVVGALFLYLGGIKLLLYVIGSKFYLAGVDFKVLLLSTVFLPIIPLSTVLTAANKVSTLIMQVSIAVLSGTVVYLLCGVYGFRDVFALGTLTYYALLGGQLFISVNSLLSIQPQLYLRSLSDISDFVKSKS
jgi:O-antigen/teichoic acid export membrane protein